MKLILFKAFLREYKTNPKIAMMRCFIMTFKYSGIFITGVKAEDFSFNVYSEREREREEKEERKTEREKKRKKKRERKKDIERKKEKERERESRKNEKIEQKSQ